jgi:hypothetical protein
MPWKVETPEPVLKTHVNLPEHAPPSSPAEADQHDAAKSFLRSLALAVGRPNDPVLISIDGHANPEHGDGDQPEHITITVTAAHHPDSEPVPSGEPIEIPTASGDVHRMTAN